LGGEFGLKRDEEQKKSRKGAIPARLMAFTALFRRDNDKWVMRKMTKHVE
jgi:hypothetical protein